MRTRPVLLGYTVMAALVTVDPAGAAEKCASFKGLLLHPGSFAGEVCYGASRCLQPSGRKTNGNIANAAGTADYTPGRGMYSLGCGGQLVLKFDQGIADGPGNDLIVFEVGTADEPTRVDISQDYMTWQYVGVASGGTSGLDISAVAAPAPERTYRFLRLTDQRRSCGGSASGADVDAVATYGLSWIKANSVRFSYGSAELSDQTKDDLLQFLGEIRGSTALDLRITGHTDSTGRSEDNQELSERRALALRRFLLGNAAFAELNPRMRGEGETMPMAPNASENGRAQNRRAEFVIRAIDFCR